MKYTNSAISLEERAADLLAHMTVPEKIAQMTQIAYSEIPREEALMWAERGAGSFFHVLGDNARELQGLALKTRLGIPVIFGIDAIHGHGLHWGATIFPCQLALACAWDRELTREVGRISAREVAADGLHWTFSPVLCLGRDTRWGRIDETFGEDPFLAGELGAAIVKGYQGDDLTADDSILACAKHYLGYGEATGAKDSYDTEVTLRKIREVLLPPFQKAVEAGCATIMTSYGSIDGTPLTSNGVVIRDLLKNELGFDGFVVTDWDNVRHLVDEQRVASDLREASALAIAAGQDMIMRTHGFYDAAPSLHESGLLDIKAVDEAVLRILTVKFRMGLFEKPEKSGDQSIFACPAHLESSLRAARDSVVLLENNGILPFNKGIKRIAVAGDIADDVRALYGDWTHFTHPRHDYDTMPAQPYFTMFAGLKTIGEQHGANVSLVNEAEQARDSDAIVFVLGDRYEEFGEFKDRADLSPPSKDLQLFDELRKMNKPIITVLSSSKPLCLGRIATESAAVVCLFHGGQYNGQAVAEALFGLFNPSGKLPITFPVHSGQLPVYYSHLPGWHGGKYCDISAEPLYAFGYGLSYTSFQYSNLQADAVNLTVSVDVKNTGSVSGTEVVQLYFRDDVSSVMTPVKRLMAFSKIPLEPGETKNVTFPLTREDFSLINAVGKRVTEPGTFTIMAGGDSRDKSHISVQITLE